MTSEPRLLSGDCREVMRDLADNSVDSIVTDPPYGIRFMGMAWDDPDIAALSETRRKTEGVRVRPPGCGMGHSSPAAAAGVYDLTPSAMRAFQAFSEAWAREAFRVLKPGGHLLSFSSARTYHRMTAGIEDAGFEVRDQIMWVYGSGFPKSLDVSKAMDKAAGAEREVIGAYRSPEGTTGLNSKGMGFSGGLAGSLDDRTLTAPATDLARQWQGWGTALKPAHEPIVVARKPLEGTVAANVARWGTGALNIDGCRVDLDGGVKTAGGCKQARRKQLGYGFAADFQNSEDNTKGRWPANLIHDGSGEVMDLFAAFGEKKGATSNSTGKSGDVMRLGLKGSETLPGFGDTGTAARFFYCAKSSKADRDAGLDGMEPQRIGHNLSSNACARCGLRVKANGSGKKCECGDLRETVKLETATRNTHPTVKPTALMRYLCRLVTPPGGVILDPFMGSGSTGRGAVLEGFRFIGIDITADYVTIARKRIAAA